jgi:hypothetical protein
VDELAHGSFRDAQRRGQLGAAQPLQRTARQRLALAGWQPVHGGENRAQVGATLDEHLERLATGIEFPERRLPRGADPDCRVAQDRVQPSPRMADLGAGGQRRKGTEKGLLNDILGVAVRAQSPGVGQELGSVTLGEDREGPRMAVTGEAQQPRVGLRTEVQVR